MATDADGQVAVAIANAAQDIAKVQKALNDADVHVEKIVKVLRDAEKSLGNKQLTGNIKDFKDAVRVSCDKGEKVLSISKESMKPKVESVRKLLEEITQKKQLTSEQVKEEIDRVKEIRLISSDFCDALKDFQDSLGCVEDPVKSVADNQRPEEAEATGSKSSNRKIGGAVTGVLGVAAVIVGGAAAAATAGVALPAAVVAAVAATEVAAAVGVGSGVVAVISGIVTCSREAHFNKKIQHIRSTIQSLARMSSELKDSAEKIQSIVLLTKESIERLYGILQALESIKEDKATIELQQMQLDEKDARIKELEALVMMQNKEQESG